MGLLEELRNEMYGGINIPSSTFFKPDDEFLKWIGEKANGRMILDIGCGNGTVLRGLKRNGYEKLMGVDPFSDMMEFQQKAREESGGMIHFLPYGVETDRLKDFLSPFPKDSVLMLLCRPCHNAVLTNGTVELARFLEAELLYIGKEDNVEIDLDIDGIDYDLLQHKGSSRDGEIVLQLN